MTKKALTDAKYRYRVACARARLPLVGEMFAQDKKDARALLLALVRDQSQWTDSTGATWGLKGDQAGLLLSGPTPPPGIWYGGAGF